jgi:hypothetical protein
MCLARQGRAECLQGSGARSPGDAALLQVIRSFGHGRSTYGFRRLTDLVNR